MAIFGDRKRRPAAVDVTSLGNEVRERALKLYADSLTRNSETSSTICAVAAVTCPCIGVLCHEYGHSAGTSQRGNAAGRRKLEK